MLLGKERAVGEGRWARTAMGDVYDMVLDRRIKQAFDRSMNSYLDKANGISTTITPSQPTRLHEAFYAPPLSDLPI